MSETDLNTQLFFAISESKVDIAKHNDRVILNKYNC
ncbi:MAG: hypothetical protein PG981_000170 [Wolbachia endosymbiont of Ctenocephalides orientis wCori]|nr:MAG: hypothetical protein PG981_000170 [Wolbachia endosymbiont of Ctenocephalides orientis wCori]